jgi:hypothetical protein
MGGIGSGKDGWILNHFLGISRVGSWKILSSVMEDSFGKDFAAAHGRFSKKRTRGFARVFQ